MADLQELFGTSSSSDGGGDEEGEQWSAYQETFSRVEFDAKCMEAKFLSAVKSWRWNIDSSKDPEDQPATDKGREGSWESKTNYEVSRDGDHTVTCGGSSKP